MRESDVENAAYAGTTAMSDGSGKQGGIGQLSCFPGLLSTSCHFSFNENQIGFPMVRGSEKRK